jgi:SpoVK/Ycf46/Vps4 family AAA+-type ATPase
LLLFELQSEEDKLQVILAQTKKFNLSPGTDLKQICALLAGKFVTGADIGAFTSRAYSLAMERLIGEIEAEVSEELELRGEEGSGATEKQHAIINYINRIATQEEEEEKKNGVGADICGHSCRGSGRVSRLDVWVTMEDFVEAARELKPAASEQDMQLYREQKLKYDSLL